MHQASGNGSNPPVLPKKDPISLPMTPLQRLLQDAGPLRNDGSDKFFGMENVRLPSLPPAERKEGANGSQAQYGNTWSVFLASARCLLRLMIMVVVTAIRYSSAFTTPCPFENPSSTILDAHPPKPLQTLSRPTYDTPTLLSPLKRS